MDILPLSMTKKMVLIILRSYNAGIRLGDYFSNHGWSVDVADSGLTALKLMNLSGHYDLIATELLLDDVSGLVLCAMASNKTRTVAINNGGHELSRMAVEMGVDIVLDASIDTYDLLFAACSIIPSLSPPKYVKKTINKNTKEHTC